jgi:hypothetical protein
MTTTLSHPKAAVASPSKGQGTFKSSKQVAMTAGVEVAKNPHMRCWRCGELGHSKKDNVCSAGSSSGGNNGGQSSGTGSKANVAIKGQQIKAQEVGKTTNTPPQYTYASCKWVGHTEAQCWVKNPQLKPQSFVPQATQGGGSFVGGSSLEARMGELQNTLALLVAASAKSIPMAPNFRPAYSSSPHQKSDRFEYGAIGEVVAAVATRSQLNAPPRMPAVVRDSIPQDEPHVRHKGPADSIGQSRLPLIVHYRGQLPKRKMHLLQKTL